MSGLPTTRPQSPVLFVQAADGLEGCSVKLHLISTLFLASATFLSYAQGKQTFQPANRHLSLATDWSRGVSISADAPVFACVDPDNRLHVISRDGFWATLDKNGAVTKQTFQPELQTFSHLSVSCTRQGQVVIGITLREIAFRYTT